MSPIQSAFVAILAALIALAVSARGYVRRDRARLRARIDQLQAERDHAMENAEKAEHLAYHDALTGLPNRKLFLDRLILELGQSRRRHAHVAVMFLDVDRFKFVNDSLGHAAGDRMLVMTGERIASCIRTTDTLARLGGDEFALLFPSATGEAAGMIADKILNALRPPIRLGEQDVYATGSVGVAIYPEDGTDADALMRSADVAMYKAKEAGRNTFRFYRAAMYTRAATRLSLETALRTAVRRAEFRLHYQPVVDARTGAIRRMEALIRWQHPEQGLLLPGRFLEAAEATGLIVEVGEWTLRAALETVARWRAAGIEWGITVNIAPRHFAEPGLVASIDRLLRATGVPPASLELEITESTALSNVDRATEVMQQLRALGVRVSLDDFGAGYSVMSHLRRLPADCLKLEQSFVRGAPTNLMDAAVVRALTHIAQSGGMEIVAEGVETPEQVETARAAGVDLLQGYLIGAPLAEYTDTVAARALADARAASPDRAAAPTITPLA